MTFIGSLYSPVKRKSLPQRNVDGIEHKLQSLSEFKLSFSYTAEVDVPAAVSSSCCDFTCGKKDCCGISIIKCLIRKGGAAIKLHYNAISICYFVVFSMEKFKE